MTTTVATYAMRMVVWSLLLIFGIGVPFGMITGSGAAIGAMVGIICMGKSFRMFGGRKVPTVLILCVLIMVLLALRYILTEILPLGLLGVGLPNFLIGAFFASAIVPFAMLANRILGVNVMEALLAGLVASIPFIDASGGHFERPRWFADLVIGGGGNPALLLSWTGSALLLLSILGLLLLPNTGKEKDSGLNCAKSLGLLLMVLLAGAISFLLSTLLPPVPASVSPPSKPPMSFAGNPPPPPPPDPSPIAAVQFSDIPRSSPRLKGFYFRKPDPECSTNAMPSGGRVTEMTIWYLKEGVGPLVNPGESLEMSVPSEFDRAKSASWSATRMPSISNHDDFIIHPDDEPKDIINAVSLLSLATNVPTTASPGIQKFLDAMDQVLAGKQPPPEKGLVGILAKRLENERGSDSPSLQALLITDWIGCIGTLDDKFTNGSPSLDDFLKTGIKGTKHQLSELAVTSLKARGIEARLAEGYFVPTETQPDDRILIMDNEKDAWPEVHTSSGIWLPLPVHPQKVASDDKPPQQEDRKKEIFDALQKKSLAKHLEAFSKQSGDTGFPLAGTLFMLAVVLVTCVLAVFFSKRVLLPLLLILKTPREKRAGSLFHVLTTISVQQYGARGFGETWEFFTTTVIEPVNPLRSQILRKVASLVRFDHSESLAELPAAKIFTFFLLAGLLPRFLQFRSTPRALEQSN